MINFLRSKIDFKDSRSPYQTSNLDVKCARYARTRLLLLRSPRRGSRIRLGRQYLLQEIHPYGRYIYNYTNLDSYDPLAQVRDWTTEDGEGVQQAHYFHCDQIGIPREMTDKDSKLLWFGSYTGWGRLKEETEVTDNA